MTQVSVLVSHPSDDDVITAFLQDCALRRLSPNTIEGYKSSLRIVADLLVQRGMSIRTLNRAALRAVLGYLVDRGYAYNTLLQYFAALSGFCDYLVWEELASSNPVVPFRKRYVRQYKRSSRPERQLISVEAMRKLITSIMNPRDKAIVTLLAKTGIRRGELIRTDLDDIDWIDQSIQLKPHPKRSNSLVFFDDECARVLKRWIKTRDSYPVQPECSALFINERGGRLQRHGVSHAVTKHAIRIGLHDPTSDRLDERFTPHCCRHWFTTHLRRNGMQRELIKELRGDAHRDAMDIYDHIDKRELKRAYLAAIPQLGI
ncbi:MAG: tyrosine-type recombinase/integrase [Candidatus Bathyarchaeota archaeon]|nr:tyrosine-type recombinase/integrase [Candidatus Bathyarchaeota archaeon]